MPVEERQADHQMVYRRTPEKRVPDAVIRARYKQFVAAPVPAFEYDQRWDIQAAMRALRLPPGSRDIMSKAFREIRENRENHHKRKRAATHELTMALMKNIPEPEYDPLTELAILRSAEARYVAHHERELQRSFNFKVILDRIVDKAKQLYDLKSMIDDPEKKKPDVSDNKPPFDVIMKELRGHDTDPSTDSDEPDSGYDEQSENSHGPHHHNEFGDYNARCYEQYEQYLENNAEQSHGNGEQLSENSHPQRDEQYIQHQQYQDNAERLNDEVKHEKNYSSAKVSQAQRLAPPPSPHPSRLPTSRLPRFVRGGPLPRAESGTGGAGQAMQTTGGDMHGPVYQSNDPQVQFYLLHPPPVAPMRQHQKVGSNSRPLMRNTCDTEPRNDRCQSEVRPAIRALHRKEPAKVQPSPKPLKDIQNYPQIRKMDCREQFLPKKTTKAHREQLAQTQLPEISLKKKFPEQLPKMVLREQLPKKTLSEPFSKTQRGKAAQSESMLPNIHQGGQKPRHKAFSAGTCPTSASDNVKLPPIGAHKRGSVVSSAMLVPSPPAQKKSGKSRPMKVKSFK